MPIIERKIKENLEKLWTGRRRALIDISSPKAPKGKFVRKGKKKENLALKCGDLFDVIDNKNVPKIEQDFVNDQRSARLMVIGEVDRKETVNINRRLKRKEAENERLERFIMEKDKEKTKGSIDISLEEECSEVEDNSDADYEARDIKTDSGPSQCLPRTIETLDRFQLSNNAGSRIVNDVLTDFGLISGENQENVLYVKKVERLRKKARMEQVEAKKGRSPTAIMFDERIDTSKIEEFRTDGTKR